MCVLICKGGIIMTASWETTGKAREAHWQHVYEWFFLVIVVIFHIWHVLFSYLSFLTSPQLTSLRSRGSPLVNIFNDWAFPTLALYEWRRCQCHLEFYPTTIPRIWALWEFSTAVIKLYFYCKCRICKYNLLNAVLDVYYCTWHIWYTILGILGTGRLFYKNRKSNSG